MKKPDTLKRIISGCLLWLLFSAVLWGWVSIRISESMTAFNVCIDFDEADTSAIEEAFEFCLGDSAKRVSVRLTSYFVFGEDVEDVAELFIVPASHLQEYSGQYSSPELIYNPETGIGLPAGWLGSPAECCYLILAENASAETVKTADLFIKNYGGIKNEG